MHHGESGSDPATSVFIFIYVVFSVVVAYYAMRVAQHHRIAKEKRNKRK
jgi:hypothetical protein